MLKAGTRVRILGAMSGTSLDGVDAAVIETNGVDVLGFGPSAFRPYAGDEQAVLRRLWSLRVVAKIAGPVLRPRW